MSLFSSAFSCELCGKDRCLRRAKQLVRGLRPGRRAVIPERSEGSQRTNGRDSSPGGSDDRARFEHIGLPSVERSCAEDPSLRSG